MRFSFQNQNEIQLSNCEKSPTFSFHLGKKNNFNFKYTATFKNQNQMLLKSSLFS